MAEIEANMFKPSRYIHFNGMSIEGTKFNGLEVKLVDLRSGIKTELGQIFTSLNRLNIDRDLINALYEVIRQEVI